MDAKYRPPAWAWFSVLALWTVLLLVPGDWFGDQSQQKLGVIGVGKLLHIGFYMVLAGSAGWLRWPLAARLAVIPLLIVHGGITEWLQTYVRFREGCWRDVGINTASIFTGMLLTWRWWPDEPAIAATTPATGPPRRCQR